MINQITEIMATESVVPLLPTAESKSVVRHMFCGFFTQSMFSPLHGDNFRLGPQLDKEDEFTSQSARLGERFGDQSVAEVNAIWGIFELAPNNYRITTE